MGRFWEKNNPPVDVRIRPSSRARRITLRVSSLDGTATLTVPRSASQASALRFLDSHADWIERARAKVAAPVEVVAGAVLPIEGIERVVEQVTARSTRIDADRIMVPTGRPVGPSVQGALKVLARERIAARLDHHSAQLGKAVSRLTLRDTRGRWGSCTEAGAVMLSWRLILAPVQVLDYVVAHEAAHLIEMNHSQSFWTLVEQLCPEHNRHRAWLKTHGPALHRYRFD